MKAFIEKIELYQKKREDGCWIKHITFNFPIPIEGKEVTELSLEKETTFETCVLLERLRKADIHVKISVDIDELQKVKEQKK